MTRNYAFEVSYFSPHSMSRNLFKIHVKKLAFYLMPRARESFLNWLTSLLLIIETLKRVLLKNNSVLETNEFSLNVFTEFSKFSDKKKYFKKIAGLELTISCVRDRDSTTAPQRHS